MRIEGVDDEGTEAADVGLDVSPRGGAEGGIVWTYFIFVCLCIWF